MINYKCSKCNKLICKNNKLGICCDCRVKFNIFPSLKDYSRNYNLKNKDKIKKYYIERQKNIPKLNHDDKLSSKLKTYQINDIIKSEEKVKDLAIKYNVSKVTIYTIKKKSNNR